MFSSELFLLIKQLVLSWQVIGVTAVLIVYLTLVFYVARLYRRPKRHGLSLPKKPGKKTETAAPVQVSGDEDDLGLEEG